MALPAVRRSIRPNGKLIELRVRVDAKNNDGYSHFDDRICWVERAHRLFEATTFIDIY